VFENSRSYECTQSVHFMNKRCKSQLYVSQARSCSCKDALRVRDMAQVVSSSVERNRGRSTSETVDSPIVRYDSVRSCNDLYKLTTTSQK